jgi:hypothetical protein
MKDIEINKSTVIAHKNTVAYLSKLTFSTEADTYKLCKWLEANLKTMVSGYANYGTKTAEFGYILDGLIVKYPDFKNGINEINKKVGLPELPGLPFNSIIIEPIQRYPRYPLLLGSVKESLTKLARVDSTKNGIKTEVESAHTKCSSIIQEFDKTVNIENPILTELISILAILNFPDSILKYGNDAGKEIKLLLKVKGTVTSLIQLTPIPVTFYICNSVVFYTTGDYTTGSYKNLVFSDKNAFDRNKLRITGTNDTEKKVQFINESSLLSKDKYTLLFDNETDFNNFKEKRMIKQ